MKITKIIFIAFLLFLLSSCNYSNEHKRDFVETMVFDYTDDEYELKLFIANVQDYAKNDEDGEADVLSTKGKSIIEAIKILENKIENKLDFHHTKTIVLQESFFEKAENMEQLINTIYEYNAISRKSNIYTTTEKIDDLEKLLKEDVYLEKLSFPNTISELFYNLSNHQFFITNNISIEDDIIVAKKGDLFIQYDFVTETEEDKSLGYFLLTSKEQIDIVLNSDFVITKYKINDDIEEKNNVITFTVDIEIEGDYVTKNYDIKETENFVYEKIYDSYDYFTGLSPHILKIEDKIYKSDYKLFKDFIKDKTKYTIKPKFNVEIIDNEI